MKVLFIGGPQHLETREFPGTVPLPRDLRVAVPWKPVFPWEEDEPDPVVDLRTVDYRLERLRVTVDNKLVRHFRVYRCRDTTVEEQDIAARCLCHAWPEVSVDWEATGEARRAA